MNRREFLDFSWKAALGTLAAGCGVPPTSEPTPFSGEAATALPIAQTLPPAADNSTAPPTEGLPATAAATERPAATATESLLPADRLVEEVREMTLGTENSLVEVHGMTYRWALSNGITGIEGLSVEEEAQETAFLYVVGRLLRWASLYSGDPAIRAELAMFSKDTKADKKDLIPLADEWLRNGGRIPSEVIGKMQEPFDYEEHLDGIPQRDISGISINVLTEEQFQSVKPTLESIPHLRVSRPNWGMDEVVFIDSTGGLNIIASNSSIYRVEYPELSPAGIVDEDTVVGSMFMWYIEPLELENTDRSFGYADAYIETFYRATSYGDPVLRQNRRFQFSYSS